MFPSSRHRQRALRYWIHHCNERRPHSGLGGQAPICCEPHLGRNDIERPWAQLATSQNADMTKIRAASDPAPSGTSDHVDAIGSQ